MSYMEDQEIIPDFLFYYLKYVDLILHYSETSVDELYLDIRSFFRFIVYSKIKSKKFNIDDYKLIDVSNISLTDLENVNGMKIQEYIFFLRNTLNNSPITRNRKISSLKHFFKYLSSNNLITHNPTQNIQKASIGKRLPKYLNLDESKKLLSVTLNNNTRNNIRNYAIICLFLNCCLRLSELVGINISDLKLDDKTLKVKGKGNKERIVYLNDAVIEAINEYIHIRPILSSTNPNYDALFLSEQKKRISRRSVQLITEQGIKKINNQNKNGLHTHSLRHTGATLMYDKSNTNILVIQKILGHKHLSSTEIYTHVSTKRLKYIMENCTISSILEKKEKMKNG